MPGRTQQEDAEVSVVQGPLLCRPSRLSGRRSLSGGGTRHPQDLAASLSSQLCAQDSPRTPSPAVSFSDGDVEVGGAGVGAEWHWSLRTQPHARTASLVERSGSHLASQKGCHPSRHPKGRVAGPPPQRVKLNRRQPRRPLHPPEFTFLREGSQASSPSCPQAHGQDCLWGSERSPAEFPPAPQAPSRPASRRRACALRCR